MLNFFKKYGSFKGRCSRLDYLKLHILGIILCIIFGLIFGLIFDIAEKSYADIIKDSYIFMYFLLLPFGIAFSFLSIATAVRRFHDFNYNGYSFFLMFIPIIHLFILLALLFYPGNKETNRFGDAPK
jgi:uncharacterized membrane protein YhaH (DUF805 family)